MLTVVTALLILAVGYAHMRDGLYTALCMLFNAVIAGIVAFGFFEPLADWLEGAFQGGSWAGYEDFFALISIFFAAMLVLRSCTNRLAPDMLDLPANAQYGGAALGLVTGYFLSGFLLCALQTLPWHESFLEFRPRVGNDSGPRTIFPPDRVWLSMMRYLGANGLAWEEDPAPDEAYGRYGQYRTFDRYATFEQRYLRYRRYNDKRGPLPYQKELERELYRSQ
jgi:hypothetical protein